VPYVLRRVLNITRATGGISYQRKRAPPKQWGTFTTTPTPAGNHKSRWGKHKRGEPRKKGSPLWKKHRGGTKITKGGKTNTHQGPQQIVRKRHTRKTRNSFYGGDHPLQQQEGPADGCANKLCTNRKGRYYLEDLLQRGATKYCCQKDGGRN